MKTWLSNTCLFLFLGMLPLWAQEQSGLQQKKDELENRKKRLQQEISEYNKQLEATKKNKRLSINQLLQLNRKIEKRQELIGTINRELQFTGQAIDKNITDINHLNGQLQALKAQYARMISSTYLMRYGNSTWTFLLSAKDINQGVKRAAWMKQLSDDRLMHARLIQEKTDTLAIKVKSLEERRITQAELLNEKEKEKEVLDKEKDLQQENLTRLQKK
ncbi:MAG: murein hydrolase activator EnvC family protein [Bacteroidota bacterium]